MLSIRLYRSQFGNSWDGNLFCCRKKPVMLQVFKKEITCRHCSKKFTLKYWKQRIEELKKELDKQFYPEKGLTHREWKTQMTYAI